MTDDFPRDENGRRICGAKTRQGHPCRRKKLGPNGRCPHHNGFAAMGPDAPRYKNGSRSKMLREKLPPHLRDAFDASLNDPDFLSMRVEMGLLDTRIMQMAEAMMQSASPEAESSAVSHLEIVMNELRTGDPDLDMIAERIDEVHGLLMQRGATARQWAELKDTVESRRRITDTERRLVEFKRMSMDAAELRSILTILIHAIRVHVSPLKGGEDAVQGVVSEIGKVIPVEMLQA